MGQSDLDLLLEMGFEKARAELAVKRTGGLQGALAWLEETQDKPLEELQAIKQTDDEDEEAAGTSVSPLQGDEEAKSLVCNECGKKFRNHEQASFHASKTDHTDFSESADAIAPLSEEEKKARLEELRQRLKEKKASQALLDQEETKRNEQIRLKATKESQDAKEELKRKEQMKEAAKKRQERLDDLEVKKRIKARIEADKAERRRKAEEAKAAREGRPVPGVAAPTTAAPAAPAAARPAAAHSEARLRLQTQSGSTQKTYPADTTLFEVAQALEAEGMAAVTSFTTTFPRKTFEGSTDFSKTLREAGLVPSAVLIVK